MIFPDLFILTTLSIVAISTAGAIGRKSGFYRAQLATRAQARGFVPELEGLRGLLAFAVFVHHAAITRQSYQQHFWAAPPSRLFAQLGPMAVGLFFFLSGFLFWGRYRRPGARPALWPFWKARIRRLAPMSAFVGLLLLTVVLAESGFQLREPIAQLCLGTLQWMASGFPFGSFPPLNGVDGTAEIIAWVPWSLRWEWWFYLLIPLLGLFARGKRVALLAPAFLVAEALFQLVPGDLSRTLLEFCGFVGTGFGFGVAAVYLLEVPAISRFAKTPGAALLSGLCLAFAVFYEPPLPPFQNSLFMLPLFLCVAAQSEGLRFLRSAPLQVLGMMSFSIYLMHPFVLHVGYRLLARGVPVAALPAEAFWALAMLLAAGLVPLCGLTYRWVEHPWMAEARREVVPARVVHVADLLKPDLPSSGG